MKRIVAAAGVCITLTVLGCVAFLLFTELGLKMTVWLASHIPGREFTVERSEGVLLGAWRLEGVTVTMPGADVTVGELSCDWRPAEIFTGRLHIKVLTARDIGTVLKKGEAESSPREEDDALPRFSMPLALLLDHLTIERAIVSDSEGEKLFSLKRMALSGRVEQHRVQLDEFSLDTDDYGGTLRGNIETESSRPLSVNGSWWFKTPECARLEGQVRVSGMLERPEFVATVLQPVRLELKGAVADLFTEPSWRLTLTGEPVATSDICASLPAATVSLTGEMTGSLSAYEGVIESTVTTDDDTLDMRLSLPFSGDKEKVAIVDARADAQAFTIRARGELDWRHGLHWTGALDARSFNTALFGDLPSATIDASVSTTGSLVDGRLAYQAALKDLSGSFDDSALSFRGNLALTGNEKKVEIVSSHVHVGESLLEITGTLGWRQLISWQAVVQLADFDPSSLDASLPHGAIDALVHSSGDIGDSRHEIHVAIESLSGVLAGYELNGGGSLDLRNKELVADELYLSNGRNRLVLNGRVGDSLDLQFLLKGEELKRLVPSIAGNIRVSGAFTGSREHPVVELSARASDISYRDYTLKAFSGSLNGGLTSKDSIKATVSLDELRIDRVLIDQAALRVAGTTAEHLIELEAAGSGGTLSVQAEGALTDFKQWTGTLNTLRVNHPHYGQWRQRHEAELKLSETAFSLAAFCVASGQNNICVDGDYRRAGPWRLDVSELQLQLATLNRLQLFQTGIIGAVVGQVSVAGTGAVIERASGKLGCSELSLNLDTDLFYQDYRWFDTTLSLALKNKRLTVTGASRFVDGSVLDGALDIERFGNLGTPFGDLPINGMLRLDIKDLSPLVLLTDDYLVPAGTISAAFSLKGTLEDPVIAGDVVLREGELRLPQLGITLTDVIGDLSEQGGKFDLNLFATSGTGRAHGAGELVISAEDWRGDFHITGTQCELVNQSDLKITGDPDVRLHVGPEGGRLQGGVMIPKALIEPEEMGDADRVSEDIVFVDEKGMSTRWPFVLDLVITLGDEVLVEGYGFSGAITGRLAVKDNGNGQMTGRGEVGIVDGSFSVFDRPLLISRGRIFFTGGQIDNPGLDISASKKVGKERFGQEQTVVGVTVTGTVHDYQVDLFSVPRMEERDILAYLLLDRSLEKKNDATSPSIIDKALNSMGLGIGNELLGEVGALLPVDEVHFEGGIENDDASLVVGKYLTEELSVSYDFNLFKNTGFFQVRYDFGRGFAVESRNSVDTNGVELIYSFEN